MLPLQRPENGVSSNFVHAKTLPGERGNTNWEISF